LEIDKLWWIDKVFKNFLAGIKNWWKRVKNINYIYFFLKIRFAENVNFLIKSKKYDEALRFATTLKMDQKYIYVSMKN
jgi:hypothetical protein